MKYGTVGTSTSETQVVDISHLGIWIIHKGKEYFLDYEAFPWFRDAPVKHVFNVHAESESHLRWPDLDIDICLDSIEDPGAFPLIYEPREDYRA